MSYGKIRLNHANNLRIRLKATDVATGELVKLTPAQMTAIDKIAIVLDNTNKITTGDDDVALGAGKEFDHEVDQDDAILVITLGGVPALANMLGAYAPVHLDIWFSDVAAGLIPVEFEFFPLEVVV